LLAKNKNGNRIHSPLVAIAEKAAGAMLRYAAEFGFTPAARSRVSAAARRKASSGCSSSAERTRPDKQRAQAVIDFIEKFDDAGYALAAWRTIGGTVRV
jgi:phage terminase small subunit